MLPDPSFVVRRFTSEGEAAKFIGSDTSLLMYQDGDLFCVTTKANFQSEAFWQDTPAEGPGVDEIIGGGG